MSVFLRAWDMRLVAWRTSSRVVGWSGEDGGMAGSMMDPRKDCRVCLAPSTRTADTFTGVWRFELT